MLYVPAPPSSPLCPPPSPFPRSLGRIQTKRHLCWLANLPRDPDDCSPPPPPPFPPPPPAPLTDSGRAAWALKNLSAAQMNYTGAHVSVQIWT